MFDSGIVKMKEKYCKQCGVLLKKTMASLLFFPPIQFKDGLYCYECAQNKKWKSYRK